MNTEWKHEEIKRLWNCVETWDEETVNCEEMRRLSTLHGYVGN